MIDLKRLNFGAPAAERDLDQGLKQYFYESESYKRILQEGKSVVLGNRGSGKSAIFKILVELYKRQGNIVIELMPDDYSYELLSKTMVAEKAGSWNKQSAYAIAWKYLIYVRTMKEFLEKYPGIVKQNAKKIHVYLRDHHQGCQHSKIDAMISYLKRMESIKLGNYEASVNKKELERLYSLEEITSLLPELVDICSKRPVKLLVDELDRGWDGSEDAMSFVAGLFQAAMSINQLTPNLRVMISLRKELYNNIPSLYEDAQKVWDIIETIEWDEDSLLQMICRRIEHSFPELKTLSITEKWSTVFSETLDYRKTKSFNYIVDRSLYRPREIIQFCTEAKNIAQTSVSLHTIDYSTISQAELIYSELRTKDIAAEYKFQYPGLLKILEAFRGKCYTFDRKELYDICLELSLEGAKSMTDAPWINEMDPDNIINILWQVGFLRAQAVGGLKAKRRSGSSYLGPHQIGNLNLKTITRFHIHPMFRAYLGMKETRDPHD